MMHISDDQTRMAAAAALEVMSGADVNRILALTSELAIAKGMLSMIAAGQVIVVPAQKTDRGVVDESLSSRKVARKRK